MDRIDELRRHKVPELERIVVAIDPAVSVGEDSDETGIIVAGLGVDGHGYILERFGEIFAHGMGEQGRRSISQVKG